jgi:hypothetical protein
VEATSVAHSDKRRLKSPPQVLNPLVSADEQANCVSPIKTGLTIYRQRGRQDKKRPMRNISYKKHCILPESTKRSISPENLEKALPRHVQAKAGSLDQSIAI